MAAKSGQAYPSSGNLSSAASSEFEEVGLEELGLHPSEGSDTATSLLHQSSQLDTSGVVGKILAAPAPSGRSTPAEALTGNQPFQGGVCLRASATWRLLCCLVSSVQLRGCLFLMNLSWLSASLSAPFPESGPVMQYALLQLSKRRHQGCMRRLFLIPSRTLRALHSG